MSKQIYPATYPHDAEIFNLASAETARREGRYSDAANAAALTADRASVRDTDERIKAVQSLLKTAADANNAGQYSIAVNTLASVSGHIVTIHRADRNLTHDLNSEIVRLATEMMPGASDGGKKILGHIILEHTSGKAVNGHADQSPTSGNKNEHGRVPTTTVANIIAAAIRAKGPQPS